MVKYTLSCLSFSGYMVDCPHIERMGYGGDGNSSTMTLQTIWDVRDTYRNWLTAWGDAIDSTGDLPYVAPAFRTGGGPYWSGFIIKAPWLTYLNYGDPYLIHAHYDEWCIRERQPDLMAHILRQKDYPGYLNMINHGATTTWESWDCGRLGKEDRSRVHNCYNGIGIWFYQALAGIRPDPRHPGYQHFFIDPQPVKGIDWVRCTKPTSFGTIKVEIIYSTNALSLSQNITSLKITVPQGTTATVFPDTPHERTLQAGTHTITSH